MHAFNPLTLFSPVAPYACGLMLLTLAVLWRPLQAWRRSLLNTSVFFLLCLVGDLLAGILIEERQTQFGRYLREFAVFGEGLGVLRFGGLALFRVLLPRLLRIEVSGILADILVIVSYIAWAFVRLNLAGVHLSQLVATSAVITAVLAFAMQDTLGNLLGGLALQMDNSLEIGDWIRIDDLSGQVIEIQWRYTALRTRNGERVVVPNSQLMKGRYYILCDKRAPTPYWRRQIMFNVDLAHPPAKVIRCVMEDLLSARIPLVAHTPEPSCVLLDFGPGYGHYALRYWLTDPLLDDPTDSDVRNHILAALQRSGIRLAVSDQTVHLIKEGESHREQVRQRELKRRLEAINQIELFQPLSDHERQDLAERLVPAPFARGDLMTRQGAVAHWLYIIIAGEAEAWWQPPEGEPRLLERRGPGSVFGELGLMTGAPRRATVVVTADIEAYRLDKTGFEDIIRRRPELADMISDILQRRLEHFKALEQGYEASRSQSINSAESAAIGQKILEFFGIKSS